jgi:Putative prokaryotic signal transducing protein
MSDAELVVIGTFLNKIDAEIAQSALQAADIESLVSADDAGGLRPTLWMSGVRLLVRSEDAERAQEILDSSR